MDPVILLLLSSITTDWVWLLIFTRLLDHTQRRTTVGRTPLNEWSVRRRDLYLTTHNNHNRQTSMPPRRAEDFYLPLKIRRLRPGLNPRTWVPKASTLPLYHRSRCCNNDTQFIFAPLSTSLSTIGDMRSPKHLMYAPNWHGLSLMKYHYVFKLTRSATR